MCRGAAVIQVAPAKELFERSPDQVFADVADETERALGDISVVHMAIGADVGVSGSIRFGGPAHVTARNVRSTRPSHPVRFHQAVPRRWIKGDALGLRISLVPRLFGHC